MVKIYISISDGGDGSYSVRFFKSKNDYEQYKEREEQAYGYTADDNGGYEIDTNDIANIRWSKPEDIKINEEDEEEE